MWPIHTEINAALKVYYLILAFVILWLIGKVDLQIAIFVSLIFVYKVIVHSRDHLFITGILVWFFAPYRLESWQAPVSIFIFAITFKVYYYLIFPLSAFPWAIWYQF